MAKVLLFSAYCYPGNEFKDLELFRELKKDFDIIYSVKNHEMYLNSVKYKKEFDYNFFFKNDKKCGFPGYSDSLKRNSEFKKEKIVWIYSWKQLYKLINEFDIVILSSFRNNYNLIKYCRIRNKTVIVHQNPASFDGFGPITPSLFCALNNFHKNAVERLLKNHYISRVSTNDKIVSTGSIQYCYNKKNFLSKKKFFYKYKLNINKKLFIFAPSSPAVHNIYYKKIYKEICKKIGKTHNLLIKGHPNEYNKRKSNLYSGKNSWETLQESVKVCSPEDFFQALLYSAAVVTINSTMFHEVNNYYKPIIYVNRFHNLIFEITGKEYEFNKDLYSKNVSNHFYNYPIYLYKKFILNNNNLSLKEKKFYKYKYLFYKNSKYFGCDTLINDLDDVLNKINFDKEIHFLEKNNKQITEVAKTIKKFIRRNNSLNILELSRLYCIVVKYYLISISNYILTKLKILFIFLIHNKKLFANEKIY